MAEPYEGRFKPQTGIPDFLGRPPVTTPYQGGRFTAPSREETHTPLAIRQLEEAQGPFRELLEASPNPMALLQRINSTNYIAKMLNKPPLDVWNNYSTYATAFYGNDDPVSNGKAIANSYKSGRLYLQVGILADQLRYKGGVDAGITTQIDELLAQMPATDTLPRSFLTEIAKAVAGSLPLIKFSTEKGALMGGAVALGVTGVAAATGFGTGATIAAVLNPAAIVTLPALAVAGLTMGFTTGTVQANRAAMRGMAYHEMIQQGTEHQYAAPLSEFEGTANAIIETVQQFLFVGAVPGLGTALAKIGKTVVRKTMAAGILSTAGNFLTHYVGNAATEGVEEVAQFLATHLTQRIAAKLQEDPSIGAKTTEELKEELFLNFNAGFKASLGLGIVGATSGIRNQDVKIEARKQAEIRQWGTTVKRIEGEQAAMEFLSMQGVSPEAAMSILTRKTESGITPADIQVDRIEELATPADIDNRIVDLNIQREQILERFENNPEEYSKEFIKVTEQLDALEEMQIEEAGKDRTKPWNYTSPEWAEIKDQAPAEQDNIIYDDRFMRRLSEEMPQATQAHIRAIDDMITVHAKTFGMTKDQYFTERAHPDIIADQESSAELLAQGKKGAIEFLEDGKWLLHLAKQSDIGTVIHEIAGHVYRRELSPTDQLTVAKALKAEIKENGEIVWTRTVEEQWAEMMEQFHREGRAPTPELETIFQKISNWLKNLYNLIKDKYTLTPELRAVMDKFYTGEQETLRKTVEAGEPVLFHTAAWHGSQRTFDTFSSQYRGTGEGGAAFGAGTYFTENPQLAAKYAEKGNRAGEARNLYKATLQKNAESNWLEWYEKPSPETIKKVYDQGKKEKIDLSKGRTVNEAGNNNRYIGGAKHAKTGAGLYDYLSQELGSEKEASLFLKRAGVDGIKYPMDSILGQNRSYDKGANYVVFNEEDITIENRILFQTEEMKKWGTAAKRYFGTTKDPKEAGYLLPDGVMLDFTGRHYATGYSNNKPLPGQPDYLRGSRAVDHRELSDGEGNYLGDEDLTLGDDDPMSDFMVKSGAIRIDKASGLINIIGNPTAEAISALTRIFKNEDVSIEIDKPNGDQEYYFEIDDLTSAKLQRALFRPESMEGASFLFQDFDHMESVRSAVENGVPVQPHILQEYATEPWAQEEIERRETMYEEASTFQAENNIEAGSQDPEQEFIDFQRELDGLDPKPRSYYQEIYRQATVRQNSPNVRIMNNRRFVRSLDKPTIVSLLRTIVGKGISERTAFADVTLQTAMKAASSRGDITDNHYKNVMAKIEADPDLYREEFASLLDDEESYKQLLKERETDPTYDETDRIKKTNRILTNQAEKRKLTINTLQDQVHNANARHAHAMRNLKELEKESQAEIKDLSKSAKGEARKQTSIAKKDALKKERIRAAKLKEAAREEREALTLFKKSVRNIFKPVSTAINWVQAKEIRSTQKDLDPKGPRTKAYQARERFKGMFGEGKKLSPEAEAEAKKNSVYDIPLDQLEAIAAKVENLREKGRVEKSLLDLNKRIYRDQVKARIFKVYGGFPPPDKNIGSVEEKKQRKMKLWMRIAKFSGRPDRFIQLLEGGEKGVFWDMLHVEINKATDAELRGWMKRMDAGTKEMSKLDITPGMLGEVIATQGDIHYTVDDVISMYIGMQNADSAAAILYGNKAENVEELIGMLTENQKQWAEFMLTDFGDETFERIQEVFREDKNQEMVQVNKYFPIRRQNEKYNDMTEELTDELLIRKGLRRAYVGKGFTMKRVNISDEHQIPMRLGATSLWSSQVAKQEKYISSVLLAKDLHAIFGDKDVMRAIRQKYGDKANEWIEKYTNDWVNPNIYKTNDAAHHTSRMVRQHAALSYLGFNFLTPFKQLPSLAFYLTDAGPVSLMASVGQFIAKKNETIAFVNKRDPQVAARSFERILEELKLEVGDAQYEKIVQKIGKVSMWAIKAMDKAAVTIGWKAVYDKNIQMGKTEEEAITAAQDATLRTQPQARAKDLPEAYRTGEALNWLLMFSNQLNQVFNIIAFDIPQAFKQKHFGRAMGDITAVAISALLIGMISKKRVPDEPEEFAEDLLDQVLSAIPIVGGNIKSGMQGWFGTGVDPVPAAAELGRFLGSFKGQDELEFEMERVLRLLSAAMVTAGLPTVQTRRALYAILEGDPWELIGGLPEEDN